MEDQETIVYTCSEADGCTKIEGPDCPVCFWKKTTRRSLPLCDNYVLDPKNWIEVFMVTTDEGQRFFHGTKLPGKDQPMLAAQVPPFTDIHGCQDDGQVRFFIERSTPDDG